MRRAFIAAALFLATATRLSAHVGSPDVYFEGNAGPYPMLVIVRMPQVIPGVADIEVRSLSQRLDDVRVTPMRIRGLGSDLQPVADIAQPSSGDPNIHRAQLWLMLPGAWKVHIVATGDRGTGELFVPVGAVSSVARPMQQTLRWILSSLAFLLVIGAIAIVGASVREGMNRPGVAPTLDSMRRARVAMLLASALIAVVVWLGNLWWQDAAGDAARVVYQAPQIAAALISPRTLSLTPVAQDLSPALQQRGEAWAERNGLNDLVPDHGHLMHLFLIRDPGVDVLAHLHPSQESRDRFTQQLPSMPAGRYRVFADIVHGTGFPETETGLLTLPQILSGLPAGDDSLASAVTLLAGPQIDGAPLTRQARMVWVNRSDALRADEPVWLKFRVDDNSGAPVTDLEPYMGMAGHLVVVRADWQVFAHLHPAGSAPMASLQLANGRLMLHADHASASAEVTFPYGFPGAGHYRLFVQVKRAGRVETGVFDAEVGPPRV